MGRGRGRGELLGTLWTKNPLNLRRFDWSTEVPGAGRAGCAGQVWREGMNPACEAAECR